MRRVGSEIVTRLRAPLRPTGATGRLAPDWAHPLTATYAGCSWQPLSTTEYISDRAFADSHMKVILPAPTDIVSTDRLVWVTGDGNTYEVDGNAEPWSDMRGRKQHVTVLVKIWTG